MNKKCPICGRDVSVSRLGNIHRHKSAIKKLNGAICSASGTGGTRLLKPFIREE